MLGGLSRDQLKTVLDKFPELKGVISNPDVLGAMVQNERDHTYDDMRVLKVPVFEDTIIDGALKTINWTRNFFGMKDTTELMSTWKPEELKAKAEKTGGISGFVNGLSASLKDRVLHLSVGEGQVQIRNIIALQEQERAAGRDVPTVASALTAEGSAQLVGAYFAKSVQMLNDQTITDPELNPFMDRSRPSVVKGFAEAQEMWNEGKRTNNQDLMQRAVMMTYNPGISNSDPTKWNPERILKHYLGK
ncbi:MAG: hypothetical protein KIT34_16150 [Cyanobacteria bacterium TGS_CYA1]|nr:hypothetical protein [Cyanobacteria bacterium TGS_CYA1]